MLASPSTVPPPPEIVGLPAWIPWTSVGLLGAFIGSFLNVVIHRVPLGQSIVHPGSRCPRCARALRWFDNLPLVSWLALAGRCRTCRARIAARYPLVEALTAALFLAVWWRFGAAPHTAVYLALTAVLVSLTFIDIDHRIIPNVISIPFIAIGFALSWLVPAGETFLLARPDGPALVKVLIAWINGATLPVGPGGSGLGILLGGGFLLLTAIVAELVLKKEAMGMGDVKMLAMIGAFLGAASLPFVVLVSMMVGSVYGVARMAMGKGNLIPFGPFLAIGAQAYLFVGPEATRLWLLRGG